MTLVRIVRFIRQLAIQVVLARRDVIAYSGGADGKRFASVDQFTSCQTRRLSLRRLHPPSCMHRMGPMTIKLDRFLLVVIHPTAKDAETVGGTALIDYLKLA
jgi:hypothetical protein